MNDRLQGVFFFSSPFAQKKKKKIVVVVRQVKTVNGCREIFLLDLLSTALITGTVGLNRLLLMADINSDRTRRRRRDKSAAMKGPPTANLELKQLRLDDINNVWRKTQAGDFNVILISNSEVTLIQFHSEKGDTAEGQCSERYC